MTSWVNLLRLAFVLPCLLVFARASPAHPAVSGLLVNDSSPSQGMEEAWSALVLNRFPSEGLPLLLTPYLEAGKVKEARNWCRVVNISDDAEVESYAGYFTVNKTMGSHMFFWFFPAEREADRVPLLLWLNGGPGRPSLVGALLENGPYEVTERATLKRRNTPWTRNFSMLYVDNPVGVGYSFIENPTGFSRNMDQVSDNLYKVLTQFFQLFPSYRRNDFYAGGQSYAGKYIPALGRWIHDRNVQSGRTLINFKGIYLGAGFCDPVNMLPVFPDFLFHAGLVSNGYRQTLQQQFQKQINASLYGNRTPNTTEYLDIFFGEGINNIGLNTADHLVDAKSTNKWQFSPLRSFLESTQTRFKLHAGYAKEENKVLWTDVPGSHLNGDFLLSTSHHNAFLMDNYKVLHYSGNLDVIINVPMTEAFLDNVQWSGQEEYRRSDRKRWYLDDKWILAGWYTKIGNFTRVIIRNSGHMAPYDQPEATLDMMRRFIFDADFAPPPSLRLARG